jgi:hypothetical protein
MATKPPTVNEIAMQAVNEARERMVKKCGGIGEPAVYLPIDDLRTFTDSEGNLQVILGINQFVWLVDTVLRS